MNKAGKSKIYFDNTDIYLRLNPVIKLRKKIIQEILVDQKNMQIIDIGCGNGELTKDFLCSNQVTFLDISNNMLTQAKKNIDAGYIKNATFINSDTY
jgi:ubiquinone/menaquinone biosynthesis C-methylase UbiE